MTKLLNPLALLVVLATAVPAFAQEATDTGEATTTTAETLIPTELGKIYQRETHGDWIIECVSTATPVNDPCEMTQVLSDGAENSVAKVTVGRVANPQEGSPVAGIRITAPLMTLLPAGLGLSIDDGNTRTLPFYACNAQGCITEVGLSETDVEAFKKGNSGTVSLRPASAPDQLVEATLSLTGFTAAYDALAVE